MSSDIYVSLSGMMAMETRLATVAENIANMRTVGYKADVVNFDTVLSSHSKDQVAFSGTGTPFVDRTAGALEPTGNPLDVGIAGDGFFGIVTPQGRAYTRDGRFTMNAQGDLTTLTGHPVLSDGGAGIAVDPNAGDIAIGLDGTITQGGENVGILGLYSIPDAATLRRVSDSAFQIDGVAGPVEDRARNTVRQGYREGSNVDPVAALHHMIVTQRTYENAMAAIRDREDSIERAVNALGAD